MRSIDRCVGGVENMYLKIWRTDNDIGEVPTAATTESADLPRGTGGGTIEMAAADRVKGKENVPEEGGGRYLD